MKKILHLRGGLQKRQFKKMKRFIGTWRNEAGSEVIIKEKDAKTVSVTFISGKTNEPIERPFFGNKLSVEMDAELDYYQTSLEVELGAKGRGFYLCLLHDNYSGNETELSPAISRNMDDKEADKYSNLFDPLGRFIKIKEKKEGRQ